MNKVKTLPRGIGIAVLALCLVFALWYGTFRASNKLRAQAARIFENGVDGDGLSVSRDLDEVETQAYNLATVARKALGDDNAEAAAVYAAVDKLRKASSVTDKYAAYTEVTNSVEMLYAEYKASSPDETMAKLAAQCYTEIKSRMMTISEDGYNTAVLGYNTQLGGFPSGLIMELFNIGKVETFGG